MDFGAWSSSHTILALFAVMVFIGQVAVYFYRTKQNDGETYDRDVIIPEETLAVMPLEALP